MSIFFSAPSILLAHRFDEITTMWRIQLNPYSKATVHGQLQTGTVRILLCFGGILPGGRTNDRRRKIAGQNIDDIRTPN